MLNELIRKAYENKERIKHENDRLFKLTMLQSKIDRRFSWAFLTALSMGLVILAGLSIYGLYTTGSEVLIVTGSMSSVFGVTGLLKRFCTEEARQNCKDVPASFPIFLGLHAKSNEVKAEISKSEDLIKYLKREGVLLEKQMSDAEKSYLSYQESVVSTRENRNSMYPTMSEMYDALYEKRDEDVFEDLNVDQQMSLCRKKPSDR